MTDINENQHHSRPSRFTLLIAVGVFFSSTAKPGLRVTLALVAGLMSLCSGAANAAEALSPAAQRGLTFVRANCASCHSVSKVGGSPLAIAPPFRNLHLNYPIENLEEALGEGIVTGHPTMPEFRLDPGQVSDVIAYLKSLES